MYRNLFAVALRGNLGNQLFQIAAARAKLLDPSAPVLIDDRVSRKYTSYLNQTLTPTSYRPVQNSELIYLLQAPTVPIFQLGLSKLREISAHYIPPIRSKEFVEAPVDGYDRRIRDIMPPVLLYGVFQVEEYFSAVRNHVGTSFRTMSSGELSIMQRIKRSQLSSESVAVSVRFGQDYAIRGWRLPMAYHVDACTLIAQERGRVHFTIFGDDLEACSVLAAEIRELGVATVEAHLEPPSQLQLIASHDHVVLANSTFSWWGAWLGEYRGGIDAGRMFVAPSPWIAASDGIVPDRWSKMNYVRGSDGKSERST